MATSDVYIIITTTALSQGIPRLSRRTSLSLLLHNVRTEIHRTPLHCQRRRRRPEAHFQKLTEGRRHKNRFPADRLPAPRLPETKPPKPDRDLNRRRGPGQPLARRIFA